jgi:hypothetical protein
MLLLSLRMVAPPLAQSQVVDERWSALKRLSRLDASTAAATLVADQYGFLHALWIESGLAGGSGFVEYARFDGVNWSESVGVARLRYADCHHRFVAAAVDQKGMLHIVWTSGESGPTSYSRVAVAEATNVDSWSWPLRLTINAYKVDLQVDSKGVLHLLYSHFYGERPGVYYARSTDGGDSFSNPTWLDHRIDVPKDYAPFYIYLRLDDRDGLHAVWHYYTPQTVRGRSIHYARSLDGGDSWSLPMTLAASASPEESDNDLLMANPALAVSGQQVDVVWSGAQPNSTFRMHRFSNDAGAHWSAAQHIFGGLHGQANGDGLAVDALGRVHFIGQIRHPQAVYHAYWADAVWSEPTPFYLITRGWEDPIGDRIHAHNVRLGIRAGNQLVATFTSLEEPHAILYALQRTLDDVPAIPSLPLPVSPAIRISRAMWILIAILLVAASSSARQLLRGKV